MKIITSIYVYNFHLFVSTLKEGLMIIPFRDNRKKFYNYNISYSKIINSEKSINELQGINHVLFGTKENKLTTIDLLDHHNIKYITQNTQLSRLNDISQLSIDPIDRFLYALSDDKGIFKLKTNIFSNENLESNFIPKIFEKIGNPVIANIEARNKMVLITIRNFGISLSNTDNNRFIERKEVRTSDPQDAKRLANLNYLIIADSEDGLIIFDISKNEIFRKLKLPNNDFPQQIEISFGVIIIKGTFGLYTYHINLNKLQIIREGKIGALAIYYDYVFFTSKGKVYTVTLQNSFDQHQFTISRDLFDIEVITNFNKNH